MSRKALLFIMKELAKSGQCLCEIRRTHGLPCKCELRNWSVIPLLAIHHHWRRLTSTVYPNQPVPGPSDVGISVDEDIELFKKMFEEANPARKQALKAMLREIVHPDQTSMVPPPSKVKTKEGKSKKKSKVSQGSTRRIPSKWETIDAKVASQSQRDSNSIKPSPNEPTRR